MDQTIADQLTLDAIPYYEEQLCDALKVLVELQQRVDGHDQVIDDDTSNELLIEDSEADYSDVISTIQQQQYKELQEIDEKNQKQQEDFERLFQQLSALEQSVTQLHSETNQDESYLKHTTKQIKQKQQELKELSEQFMLQNINNKENLRIIQQFQEKLLSDSKEMGNDGSKDQNEPETQQTLYHQRSVSVDIDQLEFVELTSYKQQLEQEIEEILRQPPPLAPPKMDAQTQTDYHDFPSISKHYYDDIVTANSCMQQPYSNQITPKTSQILLHVLLNEEKQKRRGCCSDCRIY